MNFAHQIFKRKSDYNIRNSHVWNNTDYPKENLHKNHIQVEFSTIVWIDKIFNRKF